jgi:hypothetical protein
VQRDSLAKERQALEGRKRALVSQLMALLKQDAGHIRSLGTLYLVDQLHEPPSLSATFESAFTESVDSNFIRKFRGGYSHAQFHQRTLQLQ